MSLKTKISRYLRNFTVIETVFEILNAHIEALESQKPFPGLTARQVQGKFNEQARRLGELWFFPSYLQRHTKTGDLFIEENGNYRLRDELLDGVSLDDMKGLRDLILNHWATAESVRRKLVAELEAASNLPCNQIGPRRDLILQYLAEASPQMFEILGFAILSAYFSSLGFSLRRFSTTYANDGGMDFISDNGIYQVTISPTRIKIERDLAKLPGTKRVLLAPQFTDAVRLQAQCNDLVLELVEACDLRDHFLQWLFAKDKLRGKADHLQNIMNIALSELSRD